MDYEIIEGKKYKKCKDTEIRNPETKRCVLKTGKIGKLLLDSKKKSKSPIKKNKYTNEDCMKWKLNKLKNPISGRIIQQGKSIYNDFMKNCSHITTPKLDNYKKSENKYTNEECIKWLINKNINPKTNKKISENGNIYKDYNKHCNILNEKAIKLQHFFLNKLKKKEPKEIKESKKSKEYIIKIDNKSCIVKVGNDLIIDNKIKLLNKFGSSSSFGINYISSFIDNDSFKFSSKIQLNSKLADLELYILEYLNLERKKTNTLHYPLLYGYTKCPISKINNKEDLPDLIRLSKNKGYIIIFNELLLGDLKHYLYNIANENYELWLNAIEQIYMCIASFHEIGLKHNDSHYGNFLYKKIEKGGYFHYIINEKDYYIPNIGYLWVIWDFGVCGPLYRHFDYINDYNLLNLYLRHDNEKLVTEDFKEKFRLEKPNTYRNWGNIEKSLKIPKEIELLVSKLWNYTGTDSLNYLLNLSIIKQTEDKWFEFLLAEKLLFNHKPTKNIINITKIDYQKMDVDMLLDNKLFKINIEKVKKILGK